MKKILIIMTATTIGGLISNMIRAKIEQIKIKRFIDSLMDEFTEEHFKELEERHETFENATDEIIQHIKETEDEFRRIKGNA